MASRQNTLALVVLLALALAVGASATSRTRAPKPTLALRLVFGPEDIGLTPAFTANITTGHSTYAGKLYDLYTNKPVGYAYGVLTVVRGGPLPVLTAAFTWDLIGRGQVTVYGYIDRARPDATYVITGGSDSFTGVTGKALVQRIDPTFPGSIVEIKLSAFIRK